MNLLLLIAVSGCDFCTSYSGNPILEENDIYFTSSPVNSFETGIYRIAVDGSDMKEIVNNAKIYSSPTKTKKIVFIGHYTPGVNFIYLANIDGSQVEVLKDESFAQDMLYPLISYNGKHVVVNDIFFGLWLIRQDKTELQLSEKLCQKTIPEFSPDGTKLAFYEGNDVNNPLSLVVLDLEQNPPVVLSKRYHESGIQLRNSEATIAWTSDSKYICYIITDSMGVDQIHVSDVNSNETTAYNITSIGASNPIINNNLTRVYFAARDGNIWTMSLTDSLNRFTKLTSNDRSSYNAYPLLSPDEKSLLYIRRFNEDPESVGGLLELIDLQITNPESKVLSNNVFRGFWNRK